MKNLFIFGILSFTIATVTLSINANAATKNDLFLNVPTTVHTNNKKVATIHGKTNPNAKVKNETSGKRIKVNKKGEFTLKYKISKNKEEETIKISSKLFLKNKVSKKIIIKPYSDNKPKTSSKSKSAIPWDDAGTDKLVSMINQTFTSTSGLESCSATKFGTNLVEIKVPQDMKYFDKSEIQQAADSMLNIFKKNYNTIMLSGAYEKDTTMPTLYLKAEDGTILAKYSVWRGIMEVNKKI